MLMLWLCSLVHATVLDGAQMPGVHAIHDRIRLPAVATPMPRVLRSSSKPAITVYGYLPNWISNPLNVNFQSLTHVAWFRVLLNDDGSVSDTDAAAWNAIAPELVATAHAADTKVHLCVVSFTDSNQASVLSNPSNRARAVSELAALVNDVGADGVNIDFESVERERKEELVSFTRELKEAVDEVYLATPAIDWNGAFDYDELALISDGMFIMGYDFHWTSGDPGPVAPLTGGSPWSNYALDWSLEDYRTWGATDDSIVMGLPLYGHSWTTATDGVPESSLGYYDAYTLTAAITEAESSGRRWDSVTSTPWTWNGSEQLWYDDLDSLALKIDWAVSEGIQGIGFWAIGYESGDPTFWAMVDSLTGAEVGGEDIGAWDTGMDPGDGGAEDTGRAVAEWQPKTGGDFDEEPKGGCGCSAAPGPGAGLGWLSLLWLGWRRRR